MPGRAAYFYLLSEKSGLARISHQPRYFAPDAAWRGWAAAAVA
jgi:hypothetical protein